MFKSPLLRKVTFELLPAAMLSFTGSILVAQYFRPAVVITPPSNEASVREDLIRTLQQERAILLDQMARIAKAAQAHPANQAAAPVTEPRSASNLSPVRAPSPRPQTKASDAMQQDDPKRQIANAKTDIVKLDASLPASTPVAQAPFSIVPVGLDRLDDEDRPSPLNMMSRPLEKTALWLKALKSKIVAGFSIRSANDKPDFPGHGIY